MNHKRLSVSLVIPAYNEECYLKTCLNSVARQTVAPVEVILVNNNSCDKTVAIASKYPFVKVINESRQGIVFACQAGYDAARGDIVARIDVDTILPNNWIANLQQFYAGGQHQSSAWTGPCQFYNLRFSRLLSLVVRPVGFGINRLILGHNTLWGSNMALLKSQWLRVREQTCRRNDIHEDLDLLFIYTKTASPYFTIDG